MTMYRGCLTVDERQERNILESMPPSRSLGGIARFFAVFSDETLMAAVAEHRDEVVLTTAIPPTLIFDVKGLSVPERLEKLIAFFSSAASLGEKADDAI